jgi:hypothetical protein
VERVVDAPDCYAKGKVVTIVDRDAAKVLLDFFDFACV